MVDAVLAAMPAELFPDDPPGTGKQKRLQEIGRCLLGEPLLPASQWHHVALWQKAGWYFGRGKWPSVALDTLRPKSRGKRQRQITLAILCAALTLIACIFLALLIPHGGSGPRDAGAQHGPSAGQAGTGSSAAAGRAPSARSAPESQPPSSAPLRTPTAAEVAAEGLDRERRSAQAESSHVGAMADADAERAAVAQMANEEQPLAAAVPALPATRPAAAHAPAASADAADLSPDDRWRRPAKQFAEEHAGIVVDRQPLVRGSVAVGELTANSDNPFSTSRIFLGPGKIWAAGQSYPFGPSWDAVTLSRSQEVPGLAQALGVPEVRLSVENTAKGFRLTLNWTPGLPTADPQVEARLEQLRERKMEIKERIEQIKSTRHVSDQEVEEAQKTLLEMLAIRLPDQPRQEEPRYANDPQAWSKARADYQGQRQEILARLTGRALSELLKIDAQMKRAQREGAQLSHQRIDERLSSLAQQVSAVVYRQAFKRESPPLQPTAGQVQQVRGEFSLSQRDFTPPPPAIARIRVQIVAEPQGGVIPLSAWREQAGLLVKCFLLPPGGRAIITEGATEFDPADVPAGVTELSVQLRFYQRGIFDGDEPQLVGQTAAQTLESIQAHKQYTLTFRIPADGWQPARNPFSRSPSK
jgi:hypothetical protein